MNKTYRLGVAAFLGALATFLAAAGTASAGGYTVTAECSVSGQTAPCSSGWYTSPVLVNWTWSPQDGGNPSTGCTAHSYIGDTATTQSCAITGPSGSGSTSQPIHVETSSPSVSAAPSRPPDSNGWYNHPVTAGVGGSSFSGIASCTGTTYAGPPSTGATVSGTCTDNAGKTVSATSSPFSYDASPPAVYAAADTGDRVVVLRWATSDIAPMSRVRIERAPGRHGRSPSLVYRSLGTSFEDTRARNGVRYRYALVVTDLAGNTTTRVVFATPRPHLLAPGRGALLSTPPALLWTPVHGANYYNVQLFRGDKKILTSWPTRAALQLGTSWKFRGHRIRLRPGRYRWYVWPGFGRKIAAHYGRVIGIATFVIS